MANGNIVILSIDGGGTIADLVLYDEETGALATGKTASPPGAAPISADLWEHRR